MAKSLDCGISPEVDVSHHKLYATSIQPEGITLDKHDSAVECRTLSFFSDVLNSESSSKVLPSRNMNPDVTHTCSLFQKKFESATEWSENGAKEQTSVFRLETKNSSCLRCKQDSILRCEKQTSFTDLPQELQLKIFSYLIPNEISSVSLVCRQWHKMAFDPCLWKTLHLKPKCEYDIETFCTLLLRTTMLRNLTLRGYSSCLMEIAHCSPCFPLLKHLDLGFCDQVSSSVLSCFVSNCSLIEYLNVEGCIAVDSKSIDAIITLKYLKGLNLSHCTFLSDDSVIEIATHCLKLQFLNIDGINRITDSAVCLLGENLCNTLQHLEVDGEELTDRSFQSLSRCRNLQKLCVSFATLITDRSLHFIKSLQNLIRLKLRRSSNISTRALGDLFSDHNLQHLVELEMDSLCLDDQGLQNITYCCRKLRSLSLPWCWEITDVGLELIVDNCSELVWLNLLGLYKLTGSCLLKVPYCLPHLSLLNLEQCNQIIDSLLYQLVRMVPTLKVLDYYGELVICTPLSESEDEKVSGKDEINCSTLQAVCTRISNAGEYGPDSMINPSTAGV